MHPLYFFIAARLIKLEVEMVVIADHNTISGYKKLARAVEDYWKFKPGKVYPEILCGIEISCADKLHIVGIFDYNEALGIKINKWIEEYVLSVIDGTYLSGGQVLKKIGEWNGISIFHYVYNGCLVINLTSTLTSTVGAS